jgi:hypothetical protein
VDFNLRGATPGSYSLILTKPDGTTLLSIPGAFTVEQGGYTDVWVDVIGRNIIRGGRDQVYYIQYGNRGNIDANLVRVWLRFPTFLAWTLTDNMKPHSIGNNGDDAYLSFDVLVVSAASTGVIPVKLKAPDSLDFAHRRFEVRAWKGDR